MAERASFTVTRVSGDGEGVVDVPADSERPPFIAGALPGDVVRRLDDGGWEIDVRSSSVRRSSPLCPHFPACGGCTIQHMADVFYERWKATRLVDALARSRLIEGGVLIEPPIRVPLHSRRRAVLTARREDGRMRLGFHGHRSHRLVDIESCVVMSPAILSAIPPLREIAALISAAGECRLTVLDTTKGLDVAIETGKRRPHDGILPGLTRIANVGRILRLVVDQDILLLRALPLLDVAGVAVTPPPAAFVQAAVEAEAAMVRIALEEISHAKAKRVGDLFCGLGAFAFAMAREARVLAIDSDRPMVEALTAAARNASGLKPIESKVRDLFKDPLSPRELDHLDAVVLDPPRPGAKAQAEALALSKVRTIVAVSCNPATLARDLRILVDGGYRLVRAVPVDQFLFSPHLEAVAVLRR